MIKSDMELTGWGDKKKEYKTYYLVFIFVYMIVL